MLKQKRNISFETLKMQTRLTFPVVFQFVWIKLENGTESNIAQVEKSETVMYFRLPN